MLPTAINLQPGLILINPVGYSVQPQGFQVAPFLIAVAPVGDNVQPQVKWARVWMWEGGGREREGVIERARERD